MALPFVDNFTGSGALAAGWVTMSGGTAWTQGSGEAIEGNEPSASVWNTDLPDADQYCKWLIGNTREDQASYGCGCGIRAVTSGNSGYFVKTNIAATGEIELWEGGISPTSLGSPYTAGTAPAVDEEMEIRGSGTTVSVRHQGTQRISVSDATYASGKGFMWGAPNSVFATIERFEVGNLVTTPGPAPIANEFYLPVHQLMAAASI